MTRRHVIVEGPDGAGKTTLVDFLCASTPLVRHARASDSILGPFPNLGDWCSNDLAQMVEAHPPSVYDRHPVISEPIYARHARKEPAARPFNRPDWVKSTQAIVSQYAYVIWCLPPVHMVALNVQQEPQMAGVRDNIWEVHAAYRRLANAWPGLMMWYNYSTQSPESVLDRVRNALAGAFNGSSWGDVRGTTGVPGTPSS